MSRSEKKTPIIKYGGYGKQGKKWANRRVRRNYSISNGNNYRKMYESWDIFDCRSNLYRGPRINGIPAMYWSDRVMTINEIMGYWRK